MDGTEPGLNDRNHIARTARETLSTWAAHAGPATSRLAAVMRRAGARASALLDREMTGPATRSEPRPPTAGSESTSPPPLQSFALPPLEPLRAELAEIPAALEQVIAGRDREARLALVAWLAGGHLLFDGPPGLGKTTMAQALAMLLGRRMRRVQFTSDLMPSDILGVSVHDPATGGFVLHPGPVFTDILLADEVNRAPPRAQSALLEAMAERRVSIDGETRDLPDDFFVIATQNPIGQIGTYPLPESQLDRFLVRVGFGHLPRATERAVLSGGDTRGAVAALPRLGEALPRDGRAADAVHLGAATLDYVQDLVAVTRDPARFAGGLSVRAGLGLIRAARAWAWLHERDAVEPEDVQAIFAAVADHRLACGEDAAAGHARADTVLNEVQVL